MRTSSLRPSVGLIEKNLAYGPVKRKIGACGGDRGTAMPDFPETLASNVEFRWHENEV
jgi:hypothetical protein